MPIVPSGFPAWTRTAGISQYGGHVDKANYLSRGVVDPLTDVGAEGYARLTADVAAAAITAPMFVVTYLNALSGGDPPTIEEALFMPSGLLATSYVGDDPPAGFPEAGQVGAGQVQFQFSASYADPYGVAGAFEPRFAYATGHGNTFVSCSCLITSESVVVYCFDAAGNALEQRRVTLVVG